MNVFISFLGTSEYLEATYSQLDNVKYIYAQMAVLDYMCKDKKIAVDYFLLFATDTAMSNNYDARYTHLQVEKDGLKAHLNLDQNNVKSAYTQPFENRLRACNLITEDKFKLCKIAEQASLKKIVDNVNVMVEKVSEVLNGQHGDIYLDITHSFRSMPLIALATLKAIQYKSNITLKGIFYCEVDNTNHGTIVELMAFDELIESATRIKLFVESGTYVSPQYIENSSDKYGNINKYLTLFSDSIRNPSRFYAIEYAIKIKSILEKLQHNNKIKSIDDLYFDSFKVLLDRQFKQLSGNYKLDDNNGFGNKSCFKLKDHINDLTILIEMCISFNLYQAAITFMFEGLFDIACGKTMTKNQYYSELFSIINNYKIHNIIKGIIKSFIEEDKTRIDLEEDKTRIDLYDKLKELRNTINHGVATDGGEIKTFVDKNFESIKKLYEDFLNYECNGLKNLVSMRIDYNQCVGLSIDQYVRIMKCSDKNKKLVDKIKKTSKLKRAKDILTATIKTYEEDKNEEHLIVIVDIFIRHVLNNQNCTFEEFYNNRYNPNGSNNEEFGYYTFRYLNCNEKNIEIVPYISTLEKAVGDIADYLDSRKM